MIVIKKSSKPWPPEYVETLKETVAAQMASMGHIDIGVLMLLTGRGKQAVIQKMHIEGLTYVLKPQAWGKEQYKASSKELVHKDGTRVNYKSKNEQYNGSWGHWV